jgi:arylsulfatase A-like enzyme
MAKNRSRERLRRKIACAHVVASSIVIMRFALAAHAVLLTDTAIAAELLPNVVLIVADDLGINDLGCYGRADHRTPNLDRLASEGMRFTCAYTAQPICSPSRAALMTGKCPARLNLTNYLPGRPDADSQKLLQPRIEGQLPLGEVTIAEWLQNAGYKTGLFGKWHLGGPGFLPQDQGFDVTISPPANTEPTPASGGKGEFTIAAAAEQFIDENKERPFFCYVAHNNPHVPLAAAPQLIEKNADAFNPVYAAMIETLDAAVGRVMAKIEALGLTQRTVFVFTSDNGGLHVLESPRTPATYNHPFRAGKGFLYEGGLRVPLIVRWPGGIAAGGVCETPIVLTDLAPTLLEMAGIDVAETVGPLDGISIRQLLSGGSLPARKFYWHFPNYTNQGGRPAGAIRDGSWKLVEHFEDNSVELFDLSKDLGETTNLAETQSDRCEELRHELRAWRTRVGARMPAPNPDFDATLHQRLYLDQDAAHLVAEPTAAGTALQWRQWREAMNAAIKGRTPSVTAARGDIRLQAKDARIHGRSLRYESQSNKNVLGFWTCADDWAEWNFNVPAGGVYEVEIQQGCGSGSGGAEVAIEIDAQTLKFTVDDTGHFQHLILRLIGQANLSAGPHSLAIKPRTKPGATVMDLRQVVLRPQH